MRLVRRDLWMALRSYTRARNVSGVLGISVEGNPLSLCRDGELRGDDEVVACGVRRRFFDCPITSEFASDAMVTGK